MRGEVHEFQPTLRSVRCHAKGQTRGYDRRVVEAAGYHAATGDRTRGEQRGCHRAGDDGRRDAGAGQHASWVTEREERRDQRGGIGQRRYSEGTRPAARSDQHRVLAGAQLLHVPDPEQGPGLSRGYRVGRRECGWRRWEWEARELWRDFRIRARLGSERKFIGEYARREDAVRGAPGFIRQRVARGRPHAVRQRQRGPVLRQA